MRGILAALALLAGLMPGATAAGTVRALFVGIDRYKNSAVPGAEFPDLEGPVNDVGLMKQTLRAAKGLALDPVDRIGATPADCRGRNETSITLLDRCAAYADIVAALDGQIAASAPGDLVLFYFAGHGSTYRDERLEQSNGRNDSLEPWDSGEPDQPTAILDFELRTKIDTAVARGISVVTIFDSCHSGTATRALNGGRVREIPTRPLVPPGPARLAAVRAPVVFAPQPPGIRAYRLHLAASTDTESAFEYVRRGSVSHGAFTLALAGVIARMPQASYGDIADATRAAMDPVAREAQHPQAEGPLAASFLGPDPGELRLYAGTPAAGGTVAVAGGALSGVTEGSTFAVYPDRTSAASPASVPLATGAVTSAGARTAVLRLAAGGTVAVAGGALSGVTEGSTFAVYPDRTSAASPASVPLATGAVTSAGARTAVLRLAAGSPSLPPTVQLREILHRFVPGGLRVALRLDPADPDLPALTALAKLAVVTLVKDAPDLVIASTAGEATIRDAEGRPMTAIGRIDDPLFADRIAGAVRTAARYRELLALAATPCPFGTVTCDPGSSPAITIERDCTDAPPGSACSGSPPRQGDEPVFASGDRFIITIRNRATRPQYLYLFDLEPRHFSVTPFAPPGAKDVYAPNKAVRFTGTLGVAGRAQLLLLATDDWIDLATLAQDGLARDLNPLARLLQAAENGTRAIDPPVVGSWTAALASLCVVDVKEVPSCDRPASP